MLLATNTGCDFPFTYMNVTYPSCATVNGQSLCIARDSDSNGQFPLTFLVCGGLRKEIFEILFRKNFDLYI